MRAFSIAEPGRTELINVAPPKPSTCEILLKPRLIGLCGTDLSTFRGKNPLVSYPRIPGHEIAATIVEVGTEVPAGFREGMNVTVYPNTFCGACASCKRGRPNACKFNRTLGVQRDGAMTELFTMPWQKIVRGPGLSLQELVLVEPLAVGFHAAARGRVSAADSVAVIGCGMVGLGALTSVVSRDAKAIAIDVDDNKLAVARQIGAEHVINSAKTSVHEDLEGITSGLGPDVVIEAVGSAATYRMAIEEVAHAGRVVCIGWVKEPVSFETSFFVHKELDFLGSRNYMDEFPAVMGVLSRGKFPMESMISATVSLEMAGDALRKWSDSPHLFTKIVVNLDQED